MSRLEGKCQWPVFWKRQGRGLCSPRAYCFLPPDFCALPLSSFPHSRNPLFHSVLWQGERGQGDASFIFWGVEVRQFPASMKWRMEGT